MNIRMRGILAIATVAVGAVTIALSVTPARATTTSRPLSIQSVQQRIVQGTQEPGNWRVGSPRETAELWAEHSDAFHSSSGLAVNPAALVSWEIDARTSLLQAPLASGQNAVAPSAMTLVIDRRTGSASTIETVFTPLSTTSGTVRAWIDGELKVDSTVSALEASSGYSRTNAALKASARSVRPLADPGSGPWWQALNTCLAAMGIPGWILAGLSIVCGVACVAAFTPPGLVACALCIAAASGFATGVVTVCVNNANNA
ncbi:hypothetical protein [Microbacterium rhizomatis]|uniref:Uncharacterized protein n=1 Tax=Microbacterium rhizomatis TaxID=1631477 RepID=A0A5J5J577_9MICO|nr:hypothetical protein [Microbacterium rhizomatis]KAA9108448.1 hypothetical protein F6B43_13840 [Microbacterium rhizomatis]